MGCIGIMAKKEDWAMGCCLHKVSSWREGATLSKQQMKAAKEIDGAFQQPCFSVHLQNPFTQSAHSRVGLLRVSRDMSTGSWVVPASLHDCHEM